MNIKNIKYYYLTFNIFLLKILLKYHNLKKKVKHKYLELYIKNMVLASYNYDIKAFYALFLK